MLQFSTQFCKLGYIPWADRMQALRRSLAVAVFKSYGLAQSYRAMFSQFKAESIQANMVEPTIMVTMLAALGSLIAVVFESFRRSRCVSIRSCCGLFEIERELEDPEDDGEGDENENEPTRPRRNSRPSRRSSRSSTIEMTNQEEEESSEQQT